MEPAKPFDLKMSAFLNSQQTKQNIQNQSSEWSIRASNARLECANDQKCISGVRGLGDLTDPLNLDKIAQRGSCRFSQTRSTSGSQDKLTGTMRLQKTGNVHP